MWMKNFLQTRLRNANLKFRNRPLLRPYVRLCCLIPKCLPCKVSSNILHSHPINCPCPGASCVKVSVDTPPESLCLTLPPPSPSTSTKLNCSSSPNMPFYLSALLLSTWLFLCTHLSMLSPHLANTCSTFKDSVPIIFPKACLLSLQK